MWFHRKKEPYLPDGRNAETFAPHRSCCTGTCLDSRRKPGNSPPVGPANWSGCPLCSSSSPGTEECNRMPVYPRTWFGYDECNVEKWYTRLFLTIPTLHSYPCRRFDFFFIDQFVQLVSMCHANWTNLIIYLIVRSQSKIRFNGAQTRREFFCTEVGNEERVGHVALNEIRPSELSERRLLLPATN